MATQSTSKMDVYQTDADGAFTHITVAHALPRSKGKFNIPYRAVQDAPPAAPEGSIAVRDFANGTWSVQEDNRALQLYVVSNGDAYTRKSSVEVDGETASYSGLGSIPSWLTTEAPIQEETSQEETSTETPTE